jgi:hypothetical protein
VPGAVTGLVLAVRRARDGSARTGAWWAATGLAACGLAFTLAQSASLMLSPHDPEPFLRAGSSQIGWAVGLDRQQMRRAVRDARACPPGSFYAGTPLVAFAAGRRVPGDQPDGFITALPALKNIRAQIAAAQPICSARASWPFAAAGLAPSLSDGWTRAHLPRVPLVHVDPGTHRPPDPELRASQIVLRGRASRDWSARKTTCTSNDATSRRNSKRRDA